MRNKKYRTLFPQAQRRKRRGFGEELIAGINEEKMALRKRIGITSNGSQASWNAALRDCPWWEGSGDFIENCVRRNFRPG
jgi:hypothetical protein